MLMWTFTGLASADTARADADVPNTVQVANTEAIKPDCQAGPFVTMPPASAGLTSGLTVGRVSNLLALLRVTLPAVRARVTRVRRADSLRGHSGTLKSLINTLVHEAPRGLGEPSVNLS